jgi:hypothetical protein
MHDRENIKKKKKRKERERDEVLIIFNKFGEWIEHSSICFFFYKISSSK